MKTDVVTPYAPATDRKLLIADGLRYLSEWIEAHPKAAAALASHAADVFTLWANRDLFGNPATTKEPTP